MSGLDDGVDGAGRGDCGGTGRETWGPSAANGHRGAGSGRVTAAVPLPLTGSRTRTDTDTDTGSGEVTVRPGRPSGAAARRARGPHGGEDHRPTRGRGRGRRRAWAELLRVSALPSVPGDALAGAAAVGARPHRGTGWAIAASLCLYEAGMALNDWADRAEDAVDRPHRPLPSGRVTPNAALAAAGALSGAGLLCAARAGRAPLAVAGALTATVWAYDLRLKHTSLGPAAMAAARALDLLLGATATAMGPAGGRGSGSRSARAALSAAAALGAHTYAVTTVSRHEAYGGSTTAPLAALAGCAALAAWATRPPRRPSVAAHSPATDRPPAVGGLLAGGRSFGVRPPEGAAPVLAAWVMRPPRRPSVAAHSPAIGRAPASARLPAVGRAPAFARLLAVGRAPAFARLPAVGRVPAFARLLAVGRWLAGGRSSAGRAPAGGRSFAARPPQGGASALAAWAVGPARRPCGAVRSSAVGPSSAFARLLAVGRWLAGGRSSAGRAPAGGRSLVVRPPEGTAPALEGAALALGDASRAAGVLGDASRAAPAFGDASRVVAVLCAVGYLRTAGPPLLHAVLNPSAPLTRRAVGGGIRAMIPLQAALAARAGSPVTGLALLAAAPLARVLARKVSPT